MLLCTCTCTCTCTVSQQRQPAAPAQPRISSFDAAPSAVPPFLGGTHLSLTSLSHSFAWPQYSLRLHSSATGADGPARMVDLLAGRSLPFPTFLFESEVVLLPLRAPLWYSSTDLRRNYVLGVYRNRSFLNSFEQRLLCCCCF